VIRARRARPPRPQVACTTHMHVRTCMWPGCGPRHAPRWSAAVHGSGNHRVIKLTITAGENCRTQIRSIESRTSPRKFISLPARELTTLGDTVTSWNKFKALLLDLINNHVPKKVLLKKNKFNKPIWMTHRAVKLVTAKQKTFHKYKDTTHPAVKAANRAAKKKLRRSVMNFEKKLAQNI